MAKKEVSEMLKYYHVSITLTEDMLGTAPMSKDLYTQFIASQVASDTKMDEEVACIDDIEDRGWTGFPHDEDDVEKCFLWDYQVKGFLKEAGNDLKHALGVRALRSKIDKFVFVFPRRIYFDTPIKDEPLERPIRAQTPKGERTSLVRSDVLPAGAGFEFVLELWPNKEIDEDILRQLLFRGSRKGLGQWRNGGWGRFEFEFEEIDREDLEELGVV